MSIEKLDSIKIKQAQIPYTQIFTKVLQNIKNTDALAIWVYLSSLPPDWVINKEQIKNHFNIGDKTIKNVFSYLNRCRLITYTRERSANGKMGIVIISLSCGEEFKINEPFIYVDKSAKTTGSKNHPVVDHPSGLEALQIIDITNDNKQQNIDKSFYRKSAQKEFNERKPDWATMKNEKAHIDKNEEYKRTPMPEELKSLIKSIKIME